MSERKPQYCQAESPDELPYLCTLPLFHSGPHVAHGSDNRPLRSWALRPNRSPASETPGKPPVSGDTTEEQPEMIEESMRHYVSNLGELRRGIVGVALPLGSVDAIERLSRDLIAFGFGMGESQARICDQLEWYEKAETARKNLLRNVASLSSQIERLKEDSLKCTICGEPKICANGGCIGDD